MQLWRHLSLDFEPNSQMFFNHFNYFLYNMTLHFSWSNNAFWYILTHTEVIYFQVSCNHKKLEEMWISCTENFLFDFLMVQSFTNRWRSSAKPFPPWIAELQGISILSLSLSLHVIQSVCQSTRYPPPPLSSPASGWMEHIVMHMYLALSFSSLLSENVTCPILHRV